MKESKLKFKEITRDSPVSHLKPNGQGSFMVAHSKGPIMDTIHISEYSDKNHQRRYLALYFFMIDRGHGDEWLAELYDLSSDGREYKHLKTFYLEYVNGQFDFEANKILQSFIQSQI